MTSVGIPTPALIGTPEPVGAASIVVSAFVDGVSGPELIAAGHGPNLARSMGEIAGKLRSAPWTAPSDEPWRDAATMRRTVLTWVGAGSGRAIGANLGAAVDRVVAAGWSTALSHGDFVPVNVIVGAEGATAVLDWADIDIRHDLLDAAWWCLVVRHFHLSAYRSMAGPFLEAAGVAADPVTQALLADVASLRAVELSQTATSDRQAVLLELATSAAAWSRASTNGNV
jgi:aminoglycoside phosphotransferase (APT) family kinase protein